MIQPTLHGFVILDVIFGIASVVLIGAYDVVAVLPIAYAKVSNLVLQPIITAKGSAQVIGTGLRDLIAESLMRTRLAIDRSC